MKHRYQDWLKRLLDEVKTRETHDNVSVAGLIVEGENLIEISPPSFHPKLRADFTNYMQNRYPDSDVVARWVERKQA